MRPWRRRRTDRRDASVPGTPRRDAHPGVRTDDPADRRPLGLAPVGSVHGRVRPGSPSRRRGRAAGAHVATARPHAPATPRQLGIGEGTRALEVGCGNGSISAWLAERVGPGGRVVAVDLDLSLVGVEPPDLELRAGRHRRRAGRPGSFDIVTARAVLHHVTDADAAIRNLVASLAPGGGILLIEPDFLPVSVAEPPECERSGTDGSRGRATRASTTTSAEPGPAARGAGLEQVAGTAETAVYKGGSPWADYWTRRSPSSGTDSRVWAGRRQADRQLPRPLRRSGLVDRNDRLHRRPRSRP